MREFKHGDSSEINVCENLSVLHEKKNVLNLQSTESRECVKSLTTVCSGGVNGSVVAKVNNQ